MRMTMSSRYLDSQLTVLEKMGLARSTALMAVGLEATVFDDPLARIPLESLSQIFDFAAQELSDPHIGLRTGFRFRVNSYAQTGSLYGYCKNLAQVIEMNGRYQCMAIDAGVISYEEEGGRHFMQFAPYYAAEKEHRHLTASIMGAYGTAYRWLSWGSGQDLILAELPYTKPKDMTLYDRVFQAPIKFKAGVARLEFTPEAIAERLTTYDPEKLKRAQLRLDALMGAKEAAETLRDATYEAIKSALLEGSISADIVADRLQIDRRKLREGLKSLDISYRDMVDEVRQDLFRDFHAAGDSFAAIAQKLCYNDQAAFNRAFHRWYGTSPGQWKPS